MFWREVDRGREDIWHLMLGGEWLVNDASEFGWIEVIEREGQGFRWWAKCFAVLRGRSSFNFIVVGTRRRHALSYLNHPAVGAGSPTLLDFESSFLKAWFPLFKWRKWSSISWCQCLVHTVLFSCIVLLLIYECPCLMKNQLWMEA